MKKLAPVAAATLMALVLPLAGVAAGGPLPEFDYNPTSGPPGTTITASGDCSIFVPTIQGGDVSRPSGLIASVTVELSGSSGVLDSVTEDVAADGTWSAQVTVPPSTPAGPYDLDASCEFGGIEQVRPSIARPSGNGFVGVYATQLFTVTAQPTSTTTTTAGPTTTGAGPTSTTRPSVAAQAQRVQPSFTG